MIDLKISSAPYGLSEVDLVGFCSEFLPKERMYDRFVNEARFGLSRVLPILPSCCSGKARRSAEVAEMISALSSRSVEIRGTPQQNPITHRHFDITDCLKAFPEFHYVPLRDGLARAAKEGA
jgi:hypothetical protein